MVMATTALGGCFVSPEAITEEQHHNRAWADMQNLYKDVEPLEKPLSLSEAVSRGLLYNFDYKLGLMEEVLQTQQLTLANFNLLPRIAANAGYRWRDTERATTSISLETRNEALEPSFSEERRGYDADLGFSWNLLDLGLSYYQAKQQSDRVLAAVERRRRVMNNMVKEIQTAYWKALSAQKLAPSVAKLMLDVEAALADSKEIEKQKLEPPMKTLEYQLNLLKVMSQLKQLNAELSIAKSQLRSFMNLPPGQDFKLADEKKKIKALPRIQTNLKNLQSYSLVFRPELREEGYQERIDKHNVTKEIIRLFPGLTLLGSTNYDSNRFLAFQSWEQLGVRATWNLINVMQAPKAIERAETQVEISQMRRLALSAAVLSQVSISYNQYVQAVESYKTARDLSLIERKMLKASKDGIIASSGTRLADIQRSAQTLAAEMSRNTALADAMAAYANLSVSVGLDIIPAGYETDSLEELSGIVDNAYSRIYNNGMDIAISRARVDKEPSPAEEEAIATLAK